VLQCCCDAVLRLLKLHSAERRALLELLGFVEFTLCYELRVAGYRLKVKGKREKVTK
jgi:hypothetical protein